MAIYIKRKSNGEYNHGPSTDTQDWGTKNGATDYSDILFAPRLVERLKAFRAAGLQYTIVHTVKAKRYTKEQIKAAIENTHGIAYWRAVENKLSAL